MYKNLVLLNFVHSCDSSSTGILKTVVEKVSVQECYTVKNLLFFLFFCLVT